MKNMKKIFGIGAAVLMVLVAVIPAMSATKENLYGIGKNINKKHQLREPGPIIKFLIEYLPFLRFNASICQRLNLTLYRILTPK